MIGPVRRSLTAVCCGRAAIDSDWRETNLMKPLEIKQSLLILLLVFSAASTTMAQKRKNIVDLIIRGGTVVTMDSERRVLENGGVAIKGGRLVEIGSAADIDRKYAAREVVNAAGKVVIPGLINGHTHVPMTLFRGLADDLDLQEWLTKYIFPAEAKNV